MSIEELVAGIENMREIVRNQLNDHAKSMNAWTGVNFIVDNQMVGSTFTVHISPQLFARMKELDSLDHLAKEPTA